MTPDRLTIMADNAADAMDLARRHWEREGLRVVQYIGAAKLAHPGPQAFRVAAQVELLRPKDGGPRDQVVEDVTARQDVRAAAPKATVRPGRPVTVGPARCQGCRSLVWWSGALWTNEDGTWHRCER